MPNKFGGKWTEDKNEIIVKYTKAYLSIMSKRNFKLIYFDGFAGSGEIEESGNKSVIEGVAKQIISIDTPRSFDIYYMVEKDPEKATELQKTLITLFPHKKKKIFVIPEDCNNKLISLADFMKKNPFHRTLAFIDPHGMQVEWNSISIFKGIKIDMWLLIPSGIGVNRMLTKNAEISEGWMKKLMSFLGMSEQEIKKNFYKEEIDLFGSINMYKDQNSIDKIIKIYKDRLNTIWDYVSVPFSLKNRRGSTMFHFILASQNETAEKIATQIIGGTKKGV
jgi:three-Cys-motif partner protein